MLNTLAIRLSLRGSSWAEGGAAMLPSLLWAWWTLLVVGQVLDVVLTREGLRLGLIREANPFMAPVVHTPLPALVKAYTMAYMALIVHAALERRQPLAVLWGMRLLGVVTVAVLGLHARALLGWPIVFAHIR